MSITFNPVGIEDADVSFRLPNAPARDLLRRLNMEDDYSGSVSPVDLLTATARLRAKDEDAAWAADRLAGIAVAAEDAGVDVQWC